MMLRNFGLTVARWAVLVLGVTALGQPGLAAPSSSRITGQTDGIGTGPCRRRRTA